MSNEQNTTGLSDPALLNQKNIRKRRFADLRFRVYGLIGLTIACSALIYLLVNIFSAGFGAFKQTTISLELNLDPEVLEIESDATLDDLRDADTYTIVKNGMYGLFPEVKNRKEKKKLFQMISTSAEWFVRDLIIEDQSVIGTKVTMILPVSSDVDQFYKAQLKGIEYESRLNEQQQAFFAQMLERGIINIQFNTDFFTRADSRYPEIAGIKGAIIGSLYSLLICFLIAFPLGVSAAIYLEEFSKDNMFTRFVEANINNLAAVPSIIFGLLGLAIILNVFGVPRSTPIAGGIVLALMTLPTIIIACRSAIKAVPPSIKEAGLAMGASKVQVVFHHVMPAAMSGTLTGTIIGLAQALGETAPLLMIGMVAFIANMPEYPSDPAAALPVQIYLWAESAERGFIEKTAAAIMVIILFLIVMNFIAIVIRQKTRQSIK